MFEQITNSFAGLLLFVAHWLSPDYSAHDIRISEPQRLETGYYVECAISIGWNEHLSDIIDAGIPLRFEFTTITTQADTLKFIRTLSCDVTNFTYSFIDSIQKPYPPKIEQSEQYKQIYVALRDFSRWDVEVPLQSKKCKIKARLLTSYARHLKKQVDMSNLCGCKEYIKELVISE